MSDITVEQAVDIIRHDYYKGVAGMAKDLAERMKSGELGDTEGLEEALHDDCDQCARVIYTFQAKLGLLVSCNSEVWEDVDSAATLTAEQRMYWALQADIKQHLESAGVDLSRPKTWSTIDLSLFLYGPSGVSHFCGGGVYP